MIEEVKGLSEQEVLNLAAKYGKNIIETEQQKSSFSILISQYRNVITYVLVFATVFSLIAGENLDAIFIFAVLVMNGLFGFIQEYRAEKTLQKLKDLVVPQAKVIRNDEELEIDAKDIVPSDIVVLREGDRIPADGKLLTDVPVEVDESILTGESLSVEKNPGEPLYSGTFVVQGRGYMEAISIGLETKLGKIAKELESSEKPKTPLSENIDKLGKKIIIITIILTSLILPIGVLQGRELKELILKVVSLSVAVIPTGLPLVVTITLALGVYRMVQRKTIVRKMASIETLGSTNLILTDKTGTITENNMSVKKFWLQDEAKLPLLVRSGVLGNTASLVMEEDGQKYGFLGDKTDGAILLFAMKHIKDLEEYKDQGKVIEENPFDPSTKLIETTWEKDNVVHHFLRGAPESVLKRCGKKDQEKILSEIEKYAKEGLRVIGFGYKRDGARHFEFLGMVGIYDPPREEAKRAIEEAGGAGIRIVMVTGDNPITALAIGEDIGLIKEGELVLTSSEMSKMSDDELSEQLPKVRIFARMLPQDKLRLVRLYKKAGYVVAVTGDGVNDALALSESHIGVAMGGDGTDIAREASDMVITDDNLYTIVKAIEEGRGIFDNIVKVVVFLLSSNVAEFAIIFAGVALGYPIPLSPTQILWVNLVSDGLPAIALASDSKRKGLLKRKPRDIKEQILNSARLKLIALITIPFSAFLVLSYVIALNFLDTFSSRMLVFNLLVVGEMLIVFIVRGGIFPLNRFLILSVIISLILQFIANTNPILRSVFH